MPSPYLIPNTEKITPALCAQETLVFYPKTVEEAVLIQKKVFAMGFGWVTSGTDSIVLRPKGCVRDGIALKNGFLHASAEGVIEGRLCTADQFDDNYILPDRAFIMDAFNKLAAQNEALTKQLIDLARDVADMKQQLEPQKLNKLGPKGSQP